MASNNYYLDIINRVKTQLEYIDGSGDYNNTILPAHIVKRFEMWQDVNEYPFICIAGLTVTGDLIQLDQITWDVPVLVEMFGYVKNKNKEELEEATKLYEDIERAITTDEDLNDQVYNLTLLPAMSTFPEGAVVFVQLKCMYTFEKPS